MRKLYPSILSAMKLKISGEEVFVILKVLMLYYHIISQH